MAFSTMSSFLDHIVDSVSGAKHNAHDLAKAFAEEMSIDVKYVDLEIQVCLYLSISLLVVVVVF
jgi:vesicle coat complex subunit